MQKYSKFNEKEIGAIDYKDVDTLKRFITTHGRIQSRRRSGVSAAFQRNLETAIKRARFLGLLPYVSR